MVENHPSYGHNSPTMEKRHITETLLDALSNSSAVVLSGARHTGKNALAKKLISDGAFSRHINFEDIETLLAARSNPANFIAAIQEPVVLNEVHLVPELLPHIKNSIEKDRRPGRFLLTSSTELSLDTLTSRIEQLKLWPLSQGEIHRHQETFIDKLFSHHGFSMIPPAPSETSIANRIVEGGYNIAEKKQKKDMWFKNYITTLLHKDIRELSNINGLTELPSLLSLLATRCGSLLNYADLSRATSLPQTTLKRYMALLERVFLVYLLPAWSKLANKRCVKSPKIMLNDTGLAAYLLNINAEKLSQDSRILNQLFENFVSNELQKQASWSKTKPTLFHFRTLSNEKVDLVLQNHEHHVVGIEVKAKTTLTESDYKGLKTLAEMAGNKFHRGVLIYLGKNIVPIAKQTYAIPVELLY